MFQKLRLQRSFKRLDRYLKEIKNNPFSYDDVVNELLDTKELSLIRPWQYKEEFLALMKVYEGLKPKFAMEIGTANGGTLYAHCKLAQNDATLISLDLPGGKFGGGYPESKIPIYAEFTKDDQKLHLLRGDSHSPESEQTVKDILKDNLLDYLFIDGDHSYEGVKLDFEIYSKYVRKGGVIVFHDVTVHENSKCKVDVFWNEIKQQYKHEEFIKDKKSGAFGIGIIYFD